MEFKHEVIDGFCEFLNLLSDHGSAFKTMKRTVTMAIEDPGIRKALFPSLYDLSYLETCTDLQRPRGVSKVDFIRCAKIMAVREVGDNVGARLLLNEVLNYKKHYDMTRNARDTVI